MKSESRIAFVTDSLPSIGGGEKVLFSALQLFPHADIHTLVYNKPVFADTILAKKNIKTSFINSLPFAHKYHRMFLPLMPAAIERFNLEAYDRIVCFSYAVAHGVQNYNGARHFSYTYTPMRYAWKEINLDGLNRKKSILFNAYLQAFRKWDVRAASKVHQFATISRGVSERIKRAYARDAEVIYPPVETERFKTSETRDAFYITVSRLVPHKRIDLIVRAFSYMRLPLLIVGEGPELLNLKKIASPHIRFLGFRTDEEVALLLGKARGFVCAAEEDFGIAIVEAQAAGCPIIAYRKGGATETVLEDVTGIFFDEQSPEHLIAAMDRFERDHANFRVEDLLENAMKYSTEIFHDKFRDFVEQDR